MRPFLTPAARGQSLMPKRHTDASIPGHCRLGQATCPSALAHAMCPTALTSVAVVESRCSRGRKIRVWRLFIFCRHPQENPIGFETMVRVEAADSTCLSLGCGPLEHARQGGALRGHAMENKQANPSILGRSPLGRAHTTRAKRRSVRGMDSEQNCPVVQTRAATYWG